MSARARLALGLALAVVALPAPAIDRIRLEAAQVEAAGAVVQQLRATLSIPDDERSRVRIEAARVTLPPAVQAQTGALSALQLTCEDPVIREPVLACPKLALAARAERMPALRFDGEVSLDSATGAARVKGLGPQLAGSRLRIGIEKQGDEIDADMDLPRTSVTALLPVFAPWLALPEDFSLSGEVTVHAQLRQRSGRRSATVTADLQQISFQNGAATWIGEKLAASLEATLDLASEPYVWRMRLGGNEGQFLGGPVLLDLRRNRLELEAQGRFDGQTLEIGHFSSQQQQLARATGAARLQLFPLQVRQARIELDELLFPDAYGSYLQLALTTTPFNQLQTEGVVRGVLEVADNRPVAAELEVEGLTLRDASRELEVTGVEAALYWTADQTGPPRPSFLSWNSSRGWGFTGARTRIDFATQDRDFRLLHPARLPLFDGALAIDTLAFEDFGREDMSGEFKAHVEPISLAPIARALGWPEFAGSLSGDIPGLTYRNKLLKLEGDLEADVFDGRVVASNLSVQDPLGQFPRLHADIVARNLDLDLITRAFDFGGMTGRLDVDVNGLETFNWTPTAFDLSIRTPADDRSPHRISQRAVQNLSNVAGGGGAVNAALQGWMLRFFETFRYDRIGLSCRLRNDVCQMGGVAPTKTGGYYIIRGSGVPRIDIIGVSERVDWPRFLAQVKAGLSNTEGFVVN